MRKRGAAWTEGKRTGRAEGSPWQIVQGLGQEFQNCRRAGKPALATHRAVMVGRKARAENA